MRKVKKILYLFVFISLVFACNNDTASEDNCTVGESGITVSPSSSSSSRFSLAVGNTQVFTPTITPGNATNKNVIWNAEKPSVATVDYNGTVTAEASGTAEITVTTQCTYKSTTIYITVP